MSEMNAVRPKLGGIRRVEKRDPAPSRASYRMQRLMLTPLFRATLRVGIPAFLIVATAGIYFGSAERREAAVMWVSEQRHAVETRPEFMVGLMSIEGASNEVATDIREIIPVDFPVSQFDLDLTGMRTSILELDAVADVSLRIQAGTLHMDIEERLPSVVWRGMNGVELLDQNGHRVAGVPARASRPDLPLVAGVGAEVAIPEALSILAEAHPLREHILGLVRVGERRWDLVLTGDKRIMLPEDNPVAALSRVIVLDQTRELLSRDVARIDMRLNQRPTLRMNDAAREEMRRIKAIELGADQ